MSNDDAMSNDDGWATVSNKSKTNRKTPPPPHPNWATPLPIVDPIPATTENTHYNPFLLLLMGLPGSGKSTLAQMLDTTMPYKFVRINQDALGNRKKCENRLRNVLGLTGNTAAVLCPVIDRCNFDAQQRGHWYGTAKEYSQKTSKALPVDLVVLDVAAVECLRRCTARQHHETISTVQQARTAIAHMQRQWQLPTPKEQKQYRSVTVVKNADQFQDVLVKLLNQRE